MTEAPFNPYREWLGLNADTTRPNYYQLCGLSTGITDHDKIQAAVERAVVRVRSCRPGPHAREWAQLLDELAAAKATLLDPAARAKYDQRLAAPSTANTLADSADTAPAAAPTEVAAVNRDPNLYPPGMAPPGAPAAKGKTPPKPRKTARRRGKPAETQAGSAAAPAAKSAARKTQPHAAQRPKETAASTTQPATGAGTTGKAAAAQPAKAERKSSRPQTPQRGETAASGNAAGTTVDEDVMRGPVNAHVAPPPKPQSSIWPIAAAISAAVVLITLAILYVALYAGS